MKGEIALSNGKAQSNCPEVGVAAATDQKRIRPVRGKGQGQDSLAVSKDSPISV